jgi:hypothetical protein
VRACAATDEGDDREGAKPVHRWERVRVGAPIN